MIQNCPVCNKTLFENIFSLNKINKYNLNYFNNINNALNAQSVQVNFVECKTCGFLFNKIYKQLSYNVDYNANRSYSKKFDNYLNQVVTYLDNLVLKKNNINNILEIGYGEALFMKKLSKLKNYNFKKIIGFDPSSNTLSNINIKGLNLVKGYYTKKTLVKPDLLILQHTLEHISDVNSFLKTLLHEKPKFIFIEVPCKSFVYNGNIHYFTNEHCSYFDKYSIQVLLKEYGYRKLSIKKVFNGENMLSIFTKTNRDIKIIKDDFNIFPKFKLDKFRKKILNNFNFNYDFFWGAAGKGVMLFNILNINHKKCPFVFDINKEIQGKFIGTSGIKVISPFSLPKYIHKKSKIFIMNSLYKNEVENFLKKLKLNNKVRCLFN